MYIYNIHITMYKLNLILNLENEHIQNMQATIPDCCLQDDSTALDLSWNVCNRRKDFDSLANFSARTLSGPTRPEHFGNRSSVPMSYSTLRNHTFIYFYRNCLRQGAAPGVGGQDAVQRRNSFGEGSFILSCNGPCTGRVTIAQMVSKK